MFRPALLMCLVVFPGLSFAQQTWRQAAEVQPVIEQGVEVPAETSETPVNLKSKVSDAEFSAGPNPKWVWGADNAKEYTLAIEFDVASVTSATLKASCDNIGTVFVNGKHVAASDEWQQPMTADVTKLLVIGKNTITANIANEGGVAAFVLKLAVKGADGKLTYVATDETWTATPKNATDSAKVAIRANYGDGPWNKVFDAAEDGGVPNDTFEVLPGFQVEKLFTVPKDELGSWVCIAFDNKGRLLASDQGDKGICRITLPAISTSLLPRAGGEGGRRPDEGAATETIVERLDFSKCEFQPTGAHGMLWAFDSLYFCCNGGPGSGLYRARDTDGDDQFDECVRLREIPGGGEHGPHSIRLSPDGKRIYLVAGNHTPPPFKVGEEAENKDYSSRVPTNWGEDLLLPRMWDANGHARGILAPGGWIASTDPDGKTWDIFSIGYRNPYDMAFNADGELFAYDADMEWDVGSPWYRPTRVVHATAGSEFGWRSGTGKWPEYYLDSLPALVDIGPGSPVGVDFGYGLKFPAKYQKALYSCDWTFGTMYAVHMEPHLSSYKATKEEFVARNALPLTDVAAGPDGALYFSVGGRGTQSELYRVTYVGKEDTAPAELHESKFADNRDVRHQIEELNNTSLTMEEFQTSQKIALTPEQIAADRVLRFAMRRVSERPILQPFLMRGLQRADRTPQQVFEMVVAACHQQYDNDEQKAEFRAACLDALKRVSIQSLSVDQQLDYLRSLSLVFIRLSTTDSAEGERKVQPPTDADSAEFLSALDSQFPTGNRNVDRELCQMLVYLNSPTIVAKTVALLNQPPQREEIDMGGLLTRNRGYGSAIKAMMDNQPDKLQMWFAFCLRVAKVGWTLELRGDYYRWFGRAQKWSGGNSFRKFLENIEGEAWDITSFDDRVLIEKMGARTPYKAPVLPKPAGPGKEWTLEEVRSLAADHLKDRSFTNGQKMFAATRCILCHRFAGDGGATGPDLTQLAGRFSLDALTEATMDPSKIISDQYKASTVLTKDGKNVTGRIVSENETQISVLTDPEDSTKVIDIPRVDIDELVDSTVSIMPKDLLKPLNQDEVLDLLAYLLSRGNEKDAMFRK
ncbi:MAG TPA: c-type cytochrome [Planctomycetaceae bacterium]|nr:c-type cytochrome [Planctomycetaceae bacterium]